MRLTILLSLLVGATNAGPVPEADLIERQSSQQVNIDLTLPEVLFFTLASSGSRFGTSLQGAGYKGPSLNYNQIATGVAGLSNIFRQNRTPANTYNSPSVPQIFQQSNPDAIANFTVAAAGTYQDLITFQKGASASSSTEGYSFSSTYAGTGRRDFAEAYSGSGNSPDAPEFTTNDIEFPDSGTIANITINYNNTVIVNSYATAGVNESLSLGACLSRSTGAALSAFYNTTIIYPINGTNFGSQIVSSAAYSTCQAGTADQAKSFTNNFSPRDLLSSSFRSNFLHKVRSLTGYGAPKFVYSTGSVQAAPKHRGGLRGYVSCNGAVQTGYSVSNYRLHIQGTYTVTTGFVGNVIVTSQTSITASCN